MSYRGTMIETRGDVKHSNIVSLEYFLNIDGFVISNER